MREVLKLSADLYVDLTTGICGRTKLLSSGAAAPRLTADQLKIMNCLVKNRELLCTKDQLESLFDSRPDTYPSIKQHICRIKETFVSVDPSFTKDVARSVFQSVRKAGYIFHIPEQGELIEIKTSSDAVVLIDCRLIKKMELSVPTDIDNLKNIFYSVTNDRTVILQAVCNRLQMITPDYQRMINELSSYVFEADTPPAPVFLLGDSGSGKSTLLCSVAVQTALMHPGWNVYDLDISRFRKEEINQMLDSMYENGVSKIRRNLLCIDHPHTDPEIFTSLYQDLLLINNPYIYVVIADRTSSILNLLESAPVFSRNSYIRGFCLDDTDSEEQEAPCLRMSPVQFYALKHYFFSERLRKSITDRMIEHFSIRKKLNQDIVKRALSSVFYEERGLIDIFVDFKRIYNVLIHDQMAGEKDTYLPQISMDWDEWKIKCRELDQECSRLMISDIFPYLAVCVIFRIPCTFELIREMTGYPYKGELTRRFPPGLGESIQFKDDYFQFRNDTVMENYFVFHPEITPQSCLENMITKRYMDERTVVFFEKTVFTFRNCRYPRLIPYDLDFKNLLTLFMKESSYVEILKENYRVHSPELALLAIKYGDELDKAQRNSLQNDFSESFTRTISTTSDSVVQLYYWLKYFEASMHQCLDVPESLVQYAADHGTKHMKFLLAMLDKLYKDNKFAVDQKWRDYFCKHMSSLSIKLMAQYPEESLPRIAYGDMLMKQKKYNEAEEYYQSALLLAQSQGFRQLLLLKLSACYSSQADESIDSSDPEYDTFHKFIFKMNDSFEQAINIAESIGPLAYIQAVLSFCRAAMKYCMYDECYEYLIELIKMFPETQDDMYRVLAALGILHRVSEEINPYYNLDDAVKCFRSAYFLFKKNQSYLGEDTGLTILIPLAKTYYENKQYKEAIETCNYALMDKYHSPVLRDLIRKCRDEMYGDS